MNQFLTFISVRWHERNGVLVVLQAQERIDRESISHVHIRPVARNGVLVLVLVLVVLRRKKESGEGHVK